MGRNDHKGGGVMGRNDHRSEERKDGEVMDTLMDILSSVIALVYF